MNSNATYALVKSHFNYQIFAKAELKRLPAFKLPRDKVQCVSRVSSTIMNLLSLAADRLVPAADDFLPVLVYVIIQANPPGLLSTGTKRI